jgi:hypothetical protein
MSQRTGTTERRLRDHAPQIEAVRRELDGRSGRADSEALREFASIFLRRASDAFLRSRSVSDLTAQTVSV